MLFHRTTRQVTLSGEGQRFFPVAKRLIYDFHLAIDDLKTGSEERKRHIAISTSPTANNIILGQLIKTYHGIYSKIDISVYGAGASKIEQQVLKLIRRFWAGQQPHTAP